MAIFENLPRLIKTFYYYNSNKRVLVKDSPFSLPGITTNNVSFSQVVEQFLNTVDIENNHYFRKEVIVI